MALQQLEINRFSNDGEVLRKIRCLAGRVTVFRSQSESDLEKFKRALEGKPQQDRFSVLLDGGPFSPPKHIFIGFGALDEAPIQGTSASYLAEAGVRPESIENLLTQFGLGGLSQQPCSSMAAHEWKSLRMLAASHSPEASKVIILNEPFDEIPDSFKDPIAERLAKFAWEKQAIIIVTKLSYRPQVWIENDYIARVQLERPRQGTIGFGGGESAISEHLEMLRKEHGTSVTGGAPKSNVPDLLATNNSRSAALVEHLQSPRVVGLTFSLLIVILGSLYYLWNTSAPMDAESNVQTLASNSTNQMTTGGAGVGDSSNNNGDRPVSGGLVNNTQSPTPLMDGYPETVRTAWVAAIEHPISLLRPIQAGKSEISEAGSGDNPSLLDSPIQALYEELTKNH